MASPITRSNLMTPEELAERWRVTKRWVLDAARNGRIPAIKLGAHWRHRIDLVEAFEREEWSPNGS